MFTSNHEPNVITPLTETTKTVDVEKGSDGHLRVRDHRKLAICSILCGLSCLGIVSLIYSVKTREFTKRSGDKMTKIQMTKAKEYSKKALKWGIGAFVALLGLIVLVPLLMGLLSYLLTFIN